MNLTEKNTASFSPQRRQLMRQLAALGMSSGVPGLALAQSAPLQQDPWRQAERIIATLSQPLQFRAADYPVTHYGALSCTVRKVAAWISFEEQGMLDTPDEHAPDCYQAIRTAIETCHREGGGRVLIPAGNWYCAGPIVLLSNVHLHLESGAHLYFSHRPDDYARYGEVDCGEQGRLTVSRWQSNDCLNYSPMIYANNQENIALTGADWSSVLDGQGGVPFNEYGDCWWTWKGKLKTINAIAQGSVPNYREGKPSENAVNPLNVGSLRQLVASISPQQQALIQGAGDKWRADANYLPALSEAAVPLAQRVFGKGHYLRPPMIQLISCRRVLLQGYEVRNTPFWQHHPVNCRQLVIRGVHAKSHGPNSDGFDPEACDHVLVEDCTFDSGDDCIAIKAGKNLDTQFGPSQNIVIQNCTMQSGHGAVTLGSEMAGGIQHVYAQNLLFENRHWKTNPLNTAIRLKTNLNRGGYLKHFYVRNVRIPNGVQTSPSFYSSLPGSPIQSKTVATAAGAVITFDCDYTPVSDNVRIRPPVVENIDISDITVGNVQTARGEFSCYQAIVILGPVASDYNGSAPAPVIHPVRNVRIHNCDFGNPVAADAPLYLYNVQDLQLSEVKIAGKRYHQRYSA